MQKQVILNQKHDIAKISVSFMLFDNQLDIFENYTSTLNIVSNITMIDLHSISNLIDSTSKISIIKDFMKNMIQQMSHLTLKIKVNMNNMNQYINNLST